jgi:hypothetical protein
MARLVASPVWVGDILVRLVPTNGALGHGVNTQLSCGPFTKESWTCAKTLILAKEKMT